MILYGYKPRNKIAESYGNSVFRQFFIVAAPTYISTHSVGRLPFLHTSPAFLISRLFNDGHSDQCEVVPHCSFDLHFPNH